MPATKANTRRSFGRRSRFTKPRGRGSRKCSEAPELTASPAQSSCSLTSSEPSEDASTSHFVNASLPEEVDDLTTFERKILLSERSEAEREPIDDSDPSQSLDGHRFVHVSAVRTLVSALLCPTCLGRGLELAEDGTGANLQFVIVCSSCGEIARAPHFAPVGTTRQNELAARLCVVGRNCGMSFTKLKNFFGGMSAPPPMHLKTYQNIAAKMHDASMEAACDAMKEAAKAVRKMQAEDSQGGVQDDGDDLLDVCVSYDGTWQKRGHTSHFGVGAVIELETGLVLDFSVQSNYCHGCNLGPKKDSNEYQAWAKSHEEVCQKNFEGSSNAMQVQAAGDIFSRSVEQHNMQYVTVLSDGDSKAFNHVASLGLYDKDMQKEDCVNHVAKRMYAGMDKVKKTKKGLGGKGKLTNVVMKRLTSFYATTLKDNAPDVVKMQKGVFASLFHSYSTDAEPRHQACPQGEDSWCHFNRHKALVAAGKPSAPRPHRPAFSRDIAKELVPLYNRLSDKTLLARCCRMRTQNANESYNALVWKRCPKTEFASLRTVETAAAMAVLEFNLGPQGFERVLEKMGMK
ncbi:unnamed protein product, partial [Ixodes hexagonus]